MLRYVISTLSGCALASMISVFAQEQTPTSTTEGTRKTGPRDGAADGCVQEAKTTDGGTAYVLNKAEGGTATMYVLAGPPPRRVGQPRQSHGRGDRPGSAPSAPPSAEGAPPPDPKVLRPPLVQVESVKMVADSCNRLSGRPRARVDRQSGSQSER